MLRIERAAVEAVDSATSAEDLVGLVQEAMRLEFATIPPYLTAMLSLKPGQNRDIWWAIHDVVVDEMLHLLIGCNLLNALGGRPVLDDRKFVPKYPGTLPLGIASGREHETTKPGGLVFACVTYLIFSRRPATAGGG